MNFIKKYSTYCKFIFDNIYIMCNIFNKNKRFGETMKNLEEKIIKDITQKKELN